MVRRHRHRAHPGVPGLSVVRLHLDRPMFYHPGQYVKVQVPQLAAALALPVPGDSGRPRRRHRVPRPVRSVGGHGQHGDRRGDPARVTGGGCPTRSGHGGRPRRRRCADGRGQHRPGPAAGDHHGLARSGVNPRVHLFFGARYPCELYDLRTLWQIAASYPWLSVTPVTEYNADPPWAADYPDAQPPRGLHVRQTGTAARRRHALRQLGRPPDPDLRRPDMVAPPRPH